MTDNRSFVAHAAQSGAKVGTAETGALSSLQSDAINSKPLLTPKRPPLGALLALKPYILRQRGMLALAALAMVASALAMLATPVAVRRMIDQGFTGSDGAVINSSFLMLIGLGAVLAVASSARFYCVNWLGERVVADLRADLFRHLVTLGPSFYETTRSGEIMSRLTADTTQLKAASGSTISQAVRNAIMLIGAVTMMIVTSPRLTGMVALAIPAIVLPLMAAGRSVQGKSRTAQDQFAEASPMRQRIWQRYALCRHPRMKTTSATGSLLRVKQHSMARADDCNHVRCSRRQRFCWWSLASWA